METFKPSQPVNRTEMVLNQLGRKIRTGAELTMAERLMSMTATAQVTANNYGPGPEDMVLQKPQLPETVKGILASYVG